MSQSNVLPYTDAKPVGAGDFYFAINATFRFIQKRFGMDQLRQYWRDLGSSYMAPVAAGWKQHGLSGVAEYWRAFFRAEPGAEVAVTCTEDSVVLEVRTCPAIAHLRRHKREIVPCFCQHCYFLGEATAAPAGLTVRVEGGNGSCRQTFFRQSGAIPKQDLAKIREAKC
ncbi:MAG: hypothetical protein HY298_17670 [Verrucomicrobia bacterium]|nr:hypothetical protein [Verrucomicrobiota bacterium]